MKVSRIVLAAALVLAAAPALAHSKSESHPPAVSKASKPLGPIGLDGAPPSPLCRSSLGAEAWIHCLHNMVWHGGRYYIDDLKDPNAKPVQ